MRRAFVTSLALVTFLLVCLPAFGQTKVHPFEAPPQLKEITPTGAPRLLAAAPGGCDEQGSVSRDGSIVNVKLDFVRADFTINNPDPDDPYKGEDPVTLRSYGGCKSGPLIEVRPGNTLRVELINNLSRNDPSCLGTPPAGLNLPPGVGCFNTTNLHTHGLHVSPSGNSDNVLLNIAPQTEFPYEINIPSDHPAGTFWYHSHRHGSTSLQVASGASGVLIVRGDRPYTAPTPENPHPIADIDTILHDTEGAQFPEQLILFQQIAYACFRNDPSLDGGPWQQIYTSKGIFDQNALNHQPNPLPSSFAPWICPTPTPDNFVSRGVVENFGLQLSSATIWDTNGRFTSVNGVVQPTMTVPAGEIQRWRFVHAGIHDTINLQVVHANLPKGTPDFSQQSPLIGNREEQQAALAKDCPSSAKDVVPQFEIAADGLTLTKIHTISGPIESSSNGSNYLQPGYRSDVLLVFPEDGDYCLLDQAAPAYMRANNGNRGGAGPSIPQLLAYVHVQGGHAVTTDLQTYVTKALYDGNPQLPEPVRTGLLSGDLTPWAPFVELPPGPPAAPQEAHFNIYGNSTGVYFVINGKSYDPNVVNFKRQVNTTDDWVLSASGEPHIFHIHVNPFEIMDVTRTAPDGSQQSIYDENGRCKPDQTPDKQGLANQYCDMYHTFRDTVFVENGYQVHIRTHYDRYIGEFVIHCHILDHEDGGMMLNIEIVPDLGAPGDGLGMAGMKHQH